MAARTTSLKSGLLLASSVSHIQLIHTTHAPQLTMSDCSFRSRSMWLWLGNARRVASTSVSVNAQPRGSKVYNCFLVESTRSTLQCSPLASIYILRSPLSLASRRPLVAPLPVSPAARFMNSVRVRVTFSIGKSTFGCVISLR
eukprot:1189823-Prorocentrum_minimum.AAC.3